jgi:hypothetical protein
MPDPKAKSAACGACRCGADSLKQFVNRFLPQHALRPGYPDVAGSHRAAAKKPGTQLFQCMYTDSHVNSRLALVVVMHATNANA